jgi:RNA polymerase sigma-70 factor (ECF subfamily)
VWQEACAEALRAQEGFRGGTDAEFARWTTVIAVRALTAAARRALGRDFDRPESVDPDELASALARTSTGPATAAERRDAAARARAAIDALPETQRDVLALTLLRGCTHAEAAAALGRTEEAVRKAHLRALRALRARLGPEGGR